jgi:thioesterase domain-containing protein
MIYVIDGSGESSLDDYAVDMAGSHCRVVNHLNRAVSEYHVGPSKYNLPRHTAGIAHKMFGRVMQNEYGVDVRVSRSARLGSAAQPKSITESRTFLVGYSRGGAAAIQVANLLARESKPVEALFLFDAVDRTLLLSDVDSIPPNVKYCAHAVRNEGALVVMEFELSRLSQECAREGVLTLPRFEAKHLVTGAGRPLRESFLAYVKTLTPRQRQLGIRALEKQETVDRFRVAMRDSFSASSVPFSNCGRRYTASTRYEEGQFAGSHGALGGVPWTTLGDEITQIDLGVSRAVWTWMAGKMKQYGVKAPVARA